MEVKIIKGTKQIGGCITEITVNNSKIIIDFGYDLEENNESFELEGLTKGKSIYDAVFITHSHGDHIGLINKINKDIPVYVEKSTLRIHNLTCDFCGKEKVNRNINTFEIKELTKRENKEDRCIFDNGNIKVYPYMGDHSSYNSCMFLVEGDGKKLLHTGDFRMHGRRNAVIKISLKKIGKVDMLITEGTTLTRCNDKYMSEAELEDKAVEIMKKYNQVLVMQSSTNFDRTASFMRASIRSEKKFILDLFSYYLQEEISNRFLKVDNFNVYLWKPFRYNYKPDWFKEKYMDIDNNLLGAFPYYTMEVKESMLDDIKMLHKKGLLNDACLIYSMWEGYIDKEEKLNRFMQKLKDMNIEIINLHTSGHADKTAFKDLNKMVSPNQTIIIHTEDGSKGKEIFNNVISVKDNESIVIE